MSRIIRALIASGIFLALSSRACGAAYPQIPGIDLAWNDCLGLPGAAQNLDYACDGSRDGNPFKLVVTFTPQWDLEHFVGVQVNMAIRTQDLSVLPDWWRLSDGSYPSPQVECRAGAIQFPGPLTGIGTGTSGACIDPWSGTTGGGFQWLSEMRDYYSPMPGFGILKLAFAQTAERTLQKGQKYLIPVILLDPVDPDSCAGCGLPACIAVNEIELYQTAGQIPPQQDIYIMNMPQERQFVTWQGGGIGRNGCPLEVPVKRATWGAIKAIYR